MRVVSLLVLSLVSLLAALPARASDDTFRVNCSGLTRALLPWSDPEMDGVESFDLEVGDLVLVRLYDRRGEIVEETRTPLAEWRSTGRAPMTAATLRRGLGFTVEGTPARGVAIGYRWDFRGVDRVRIPMTDCYAY